MSKHMRIAIAAVVLALSVVPAAVAGLSNVGVSPDFNSVTTSNGFPQWYTDANGVTVDLPVPPIGDGLTAPTMIYEALTPSSNVVAQRAGFDTEAFYYNTKADPKNFRTAYGKIVATSGLEASYANGTPTEGQQVVFSRIRIKAPVRVAGTYTFTHPWGSETINVTQADISSTNKGIFFTKDFGLNTGWISDGAGGWLPVGAPGGFYSVLQSGNTVSTFLRAVNPAPPAGWIGDGVTLSTVTGSPSGYNKVRLAGPDPNLDGRGHNFVETSLFVVSGHIPSSTAVPLPLKIDRATSSNLDGTRSIDLFLTSKQGATITVKDAASATTLFTGEVADPSGRFYRTFPGTAASISVAVSSPGPSFTPSSRTVPVVEHVNITSATFSVSENSLTISATSGAAGATLTVSGFGAMNSSDGAYTLGPIELTSPLPPSVSVTSSAGGTDTTPVAIAP